MTDDLQR